MSVRAKLAAFALILAGAFGLGVALGSSLPDLGPSAPAAPAQHEANGGGQP
jgi:hypothetical protein